MINSRNLSAKADQAHWTRWWASMHADANARCVRAAFWACADVRASGERQQLWANASHGGLGHQEGKTTGSGGTSQSAGGDYMLMNRPPGRAPRHRWDGRR
jgi:hypothetical protein